MRVSYLLDVAKVIGSLLILSMLAWTDGAVSWMDQKDIYIRPLPPHQRKKRGRKRRRANVLKDGWKKLKKKTNDRRLDNSIECRSSFFLLTQFFYSFLYSSGKLCIFFFFILFFLSHTVQCVYHHSATKMCRHSIAFCVSSPLSWDEKVST